MPASPVDRRQRHAHPGVAPWGQRATLREGEGAGGVVFGFCGGGGGGGGGVEHARKRGAKTTESILGYGLSGDAYHITRRGGRRRAMRAMQAALSGQAQCDQSTRERTRQLDDGEMIESEPFSRTFGEAAYKLSMSSKVGAPAT